MNKEYDYTFVLVGQPNCGKSTIFNQIAGFKVDSANFSGTTVSVTTTIATLGKYRIKLVDLPGIYSVDAFDLAEREAVKWLLNNEWDGIINVADSVLLERSLSLTLDLMSFNKPMVLVLNMFDDLKRKAIELDVKGLEEKLNIPVVPCIATEGIGIRKMMIRLLSFLKEKEKLDNFYLKQWDEFLKIKELLKDYLVIKNKDIKYLDFLSLLLIYGNDILLHEFDIEKLEVFSKYDGKYEELKEKCEELRIKSIKKILKNVCKIDKEKKNNLYNKLDSLLFHPIFGFVIAFLVLYLLGKIVFGIGGFLEENLMKFFTFKIPHKNFVLKFLDGALEGINAGLGIVIPYLLPFLFVIALLEDSGYIPRLSFLFDGLLHKIGLHGISVIPIFTSYSCTVPAIFSTRNLFTQTERYALAFSLNFLPCAARMTVILSIASIVAFSHFALLIYVLSFLIFALINALILKRTSQSSVVFEVPPLRKPNLKIVLKKTWFRLKEFFYLVLPLLAVFSGILIFVENSSIETYLIKKFGFILTSIGLPAKLLPALLFGIFKKELSLALILKTFSVKLSALGTILTYKQLLTLTILITFYTPCFATVAALIYEFGLFFTTIAVILQTLIAWVLAYFVKIIL